MARTPGSGRSGVHHVYRDVNFCAAVSNVSLHSTWARLLRYGLVDVYEKRFIIGLGFLEVGSDLGFGV